MYDSVMGMLTFNIHFDEPMNTNVNPVESDFNWSLNTGEGSWAFASWMSSTVFGISITGLEAEPTTWELKLPAQIDNFKSASGLPVCAFDKSGNIS